MKTKTKVVSALAAMLAVTAAAATTSTFAWFTTTRTATVNFTSATVYNKAGNLTIAYQAVANGGVTSESHTGSTVSLTASSANVTDISGDGATFYKPTWVPGGDGTTASQINAVSNTATDAYYIQYKLLLSNTGTASFNVYLDAASQVKAHSAADADVAAAKATRVTFYNDSTLLCTWQYDKTDTAAGYKYITTGEASDTAYNLTNFKLATVASATLHEGDFSSVISGFEPASGQLLATIAASGSATITVTTWLEGSLSTAVNACIGGAVDTVFALAAI